jgi:hypothetical protein
LNGDGHRERVEGRRRVKFCLVGTAGDVVRKVEGLVTLGVTNLYIRGYHSYRMPGDLGETFARAVIPRFART